VQCDTQLVTETENSSPVRLSVIYSRL